MATASKPHLLLVEDDAPTRNLYHQVLSDAGFKVTLANDGEQGLTLAKKGGFDFILLDVMLPKKDGLAVLSALKQQPPKTKNGPIFLLTNLAHDSVIKEAKSLGVKEHLIKSDITPDQLITKLKALL